MLGEQFDSKNCPLRPAFFTLLFLLSCTQAFSSARAEEATPVDPPQKEAAAESGILPEIEARYYGVSVARRTQSARVYLLGMSSSDTLPVPGKLLLLKDGKEPVMAARVLKIYDKDRNFAVKRLRIYGGIPPLASGSSYRAIEKIRDIDAAPPPPPSTQDLHDLGELENGSANKYDPELDKGGSPPPSGGIDSWNENEELLESEEAELQALTVEEIVLLDRFKNGISFDVGYFLNRGANSTSAYFSGAGLRYSRNIAQLIFARKRTSQDYLFLDLGFAYYRAVNYLTTGDSFTVLPLIASLRYTWMLNDVFGLLTYWTYMFNWVPQANDLSSAALGRTLLQTQVASGGIGMVLIFGPHWETRIDLGLDRLGGSLVLRF